MDFEGHPPAHRAVVLHQILNQLDIVFGLVVAQEALNHCDKAVPSCFLPTSKLFWEFITLHDLFYLWSDEDTGFDLCLRQLREEVLKAEDSLSRSVTNCIIRPNLMCSGGIRTFWGSTSGSHFTL